MVTFGADMGGLGPMTANMTSTVALSRMPRGHLELPPPSEN